MVASRWPERRGSKIVEGVLITLLAVLLVLQLLEYPVTDDPDPDGYVSYANHLTSTGRLLPDSRRLPGYPAFLALVAKASNRPLARNVYWVQFGLYVVAVLAAWLLVRRRFGPLTALILLGIVAAPCYVTRMSVVMLPDVPYTILWLPIFLAMGWWVISDHPPGGWVTLIPFGVGLLVLQAIRPTTVPLAILFVPALILGVLLARGQESQYGVRFRWGRGAAIGRALGLLGVALVVAVIADQLLDTGARAYNADVLAYRVAIFLPPAANTPAAFTPADTRIEAAKQHFREIEGQPIEQARFLTYPTFVFYDEINREDVLAVWQGRLLAHPIEYVGSILGNLRLTHYLIARRLVPFFLDLGHLSLFVEYFPRDDGSPAATLFRRTGLLVMDQQPFPANYPFEVETTWAVLRLLAVWGLAGFGVWQLGRRLPELTIAMTILGLLFVLTTAATNTADIRYVLPFVPLIYLAEAVGLVWLVEAVGTMVETEP
jgi:hypothetical protein